MLLSICIPPPAAPRVFNTRKGCPYHTDSYHVRMQHCIHSLHFARCKLSFY